MKPLLPTEFLSLPLAHRALHDVHDGRPENSKAAIRAACTAGYGVEIDVQCSEDKQALVFHDYDLSRLAEGSGKVKNFSASVLTNIPLRGGNENIPTLVEVLELVGGQVPLLIEIKDQDGAMGPNVGALENNVASALEGYSGPVAVMSFNPHSVQKMGELCPGIARGVVTGAPEVRRWGIPVETTESLCEIADYEKVNASFISHEVADLAHPRVAELKQKGARILCWTVKSLQQEAEARKIAENITFERYLPAIPS